MDGSVFGIKDFLIAISIIINIYLLYFCYLLIPLSIFIVLGFECVIIYNILNQNNFFSNKNRKAKNNINKKVKNRTKTISKKKHR